MQLDSVMNPVALFANGDEICFPETREVSGDGRLWQVQGQMDVADADFAAALKQA